MAWSIKYFLLNEPQIGFPPFCNLCDCPTVQTVI